MRPTLAALAGHATRLIPAGTAVPIFRGPLRGYRWLMGAAAGPGGGLSVCANGSEPLNLARAADLAARGGIAFDVGANVGLYSLLFARTCSRVVAFEPIPRNVAFLWRTMQRNRLANVLIVPTAVSDHTELTALSLGGSIAEPRLDPSGDQPAVTTTLDAFCAATGLVPDVMKVDVEGAEGAVLRGGRDVLCRHRPALIMSLHGPERRDECLALLREYGYRSIDPIDEWGFEITATP